MHVYCRPRGHLTLFIVVPLSLLAATGCGAKDPAANGATRDGESVDGDFGSIEQQLTAEDVAISIVVPATEFEELPQAIRVRYKNKSTKRGYFVLPVPIPGPPDGACHSPSIAIGMRFGDFGTIDVKEPYFIYAPPSAKLPDNLPIAVLDAGSSVVVRYPLNTFCLIGHGIEADSRANMLTCYRPGNVQTEMRAYLVADWSQSAEALPFGGVASEPVRLKVSEPDLSLHPVFRDDGDDN